jgi:hypothetical protein
MFELIPSVKIDTDIVLLSLHNIKSFQRIGKSTYRLVNDLYTSIPAQNGAVKLYLAVKQKHIAQYTVIIINGPNLKFIHHPDMLQYLFKHTSKKLNQFFIVKDV